MRKAGVILNKILRCAQNDKGGRQNDKSGHQNDEGGRKNRQTGGQGRLPLLILLAAIVLLFYGCGAESTDTTDRISRPVNNLIPLQGTWKLEKCDDGEEMQLQTNGRNRLDGTEIGFSGDLIVVGDKSWSNVSYKIRKVDTSEYFLHKYSDVVGKLGIEDREVQVITASSDDKFLYEFVKAADDRYIVAMEDDYYRMTKISDQFSGLPAAAAAGALDGFAAKPQEVTGVPRSGLLLGLRVPAGQGDSSSEAGVGAYKYATFWIAGIDGHIRPVYSADGIFLPRKNGFWRLEIGKGLSGEGIVDTITASMVTNANMIRLTAAANADDVAKRIETKLEKAILYVGNDYVCVENTIHQAKQDGSGIYLEKTLSTIPVDNLDNTDGIRFSDLTGENGIMAMESAAAEVTGFPTSNVIGRGAERLQEKNFALFRKTGHWFFKGRVSLAQDDPMDYVEYNINLIPPPEMVAYDMLHVTWTAVKDAVPLAVDAYTSPNRDIAVILTPAEIILYAITDGTLPDKPLARYEVADGSSVIMAEWATAEYVQNWEKAFMKNNETVIVSPK